ncbi:MAG: hypothetical protein QNK04_09560 [Myxococcota bacterium]|nr:hypothetical protein [Myxococcota bacterium]
MLFHQLFQGRFAVLDATSVLTFAALWGVLRPSSLPRFLVVLALHLATVLYELPKVVNHWLLMGVTSLGLLVMLVPCVRRTRADTDAALPAEALSSVQAQIIIVYAMATLAKVNAGFFDLADSCGAAHYRRLAGSVPLFPLADWALWTAIVGTLVIEAALPLLLALPRTRLLAICGGWAFHLMLGWNGYWDFSMVAVPYYAAFVTPRLLAGGRAALTRHAPLRRLREVADRGARSPLAFPVAAGLLLLPTALVALGDTPDREVVMIANRAGRWCWLLCWLGLGAFLALSIRESPTEAPAPAPAPRPAWWGPALLLGPALVFLNGLSPYLGLKTEHSYTMFSNIRTEGEVWNHYLVPRGVRVFGLQDQPLRIVRSSDPYLERLGRRGYSLVPFDLQRWAQQHPDAAVVYDTPEGRRRVPRAADDPFLVEPLHPLLVKLLLFRPIPPPERNACLH